MKEQAEAKRISRLPGATRSVGAAADLRPTTRACGSPIARSGLAGTFLAAAILFLVAGFVVNVAFFVFAGFAAFGALLMCFPASASEPSSHADILAISQRESWTERSMQMGTPEYNARWDQ